MQKYIEINWLQDINIIQCTGQFSYIYDEKGLMNNYHLLLSFLFTILLRKKNNSSKWQLFFKPFVQNCMNFGQYIELY